MGETATAPQAETPAPPPEATPAAQAASPDAAAPQAPPSGEPQAEAPQEPEAPATPPPPSWEELLEQADPESIRRNRRLMGIAGEMANRLAETRAEQLLTERLDKAVEERLERQQAEADRRALLEDARNGNYYQVGQRYAEHAEREEQTRAEQAAKQQAESSAYTALQATVDEWAKALPPDVLTQAAEAYQKVAPKDGGYPVQFRAWLDNFVPTYVNSLVQQRLNEERAKWEAKELPAVRSRALAEVNGGAPVPDAGQGAPPGARVVTDEEIERMSLNEWQSIWDAKAGRFKEGVAHQATRGIDTRRPQAATGL